MVIRNVINVIRTTDSDVLAIAIGNLHQLKDGIRLYLEAGIMGDNSLGYIDINKIVEQLGSQLSKALTGFHAFTGCDQNPAFSRRGKRTIFSSRKERSISKRLCRLREL